MSKVLCLIAGEVLLLAGNDLLDRHRQHAISFVVNMFAYKIDTACGKQAF